MNGALAEQLHAFHHPGLTSRRGKLLPDGPLGLIAARFNLELGYVPLLRRFPWTRKRCTLPCGCKHFPEAPNALIAIAHLWDVHVVRKQNCSPDDVIRWAREQEARAGG